MDHFLVDYENIGEAGLKGVENLGSDTSTVIFYSEHADKISFDMHQILCKCRSRLEFRKAQTGKKNALDFQLSTYLGYLVASHPGDRFFIISKDNGYHVVMDFWDNSNIQQLDYIGRAYEKPQKQAQAPAPEPQQPERKAGESQNIKEHEPAAKEPASAAKEPSSAIKEPVFAVKEPASAAKEPPKEQPQRQDTRPAESAAAEDAHQSQAAAASDENSSESEKHAHRPSRRRSTGHKEQGSDEFRPSEELMNQLSQLIESREERENIGRFIVRYKTKQGVNNAIVKLYGTEKAGELYRKIKPLLKDKKGK